MHPADEDDRFKISSKRRSMTVAMAAAAKKLAASLPRWAYIVDRRNMAELLWQANAEAKHSRMRASAADRRKDRDQRASSANAGSRPRRASSLNSPPPPRRMDMGGGGSSGRSGSPPLGGDGGGPPRAHHSRSTSDSVCFVADLAVDTEVTTDAGHGGGPESPRRRSMSSSPRAAHSAATLRKDRNMRGASDMSPSLRKLRALKERLRPRVARVRANSDSNGKSGAQRSSISSTSPAATAEAKEMLSPTTAVNKALFRTLDKNGDGVLDRAEFDAIVLKLKKAKKTTKNKQNKQTAEKRGGGGGGGRGAVEAGESKNDATTAPTANAAASDDDDNRVDAVTEALQVEGVRQRIAQMLLPSGVRHQLWCVRVCVCVHAPGWVRTFVRACLRA